MPFLTDLRQTGAEVTEGVPLARLSSIRIGGVCPTVVYPTDIRQFAAVLSFLSKRGIPYRISGRATNLLFPDAFCPFVLVCTGKIKGYSVAENEVTMRAGETFARFFGRGEYPALGGYAGMVGIPGTVGGAVVNNAGAFGVCVSDLFVRCRVYDPMRDEERVLGAEEMAFSYRHSVLRGGNLALLDATFRLDGRGEEMPRQVREYAAARRQTQPTDQPSLGSVFLRPPGDSAGRLIDAAGGKGSSVGGARISERHAGFIVNAGGATASDVRRLMTQTQELVYTYAGVLLVPEIEIL